MNETKTSHLYKVVFTFDEFFIVAESPSEALKKLPGKFNERGVSSVKLEHGEVIL